jgi:ankyrin repeat protein
MLEKLHLLIVTFCLFTTSFVHASTDSSPLIEAIQQHASPQKIRSLIQKGADVNEVTSEFLRCIKPVLCYAIDRGSELESLEIMKLLINAKADVNAITYNRVEDKQFYGMMPLLCYAVIYSSPEVVQLFLDAGADVNLKVGVDETPLANNKTALSLARELRKKQIEKMLLSAGAK